MTARILDGRSVASHLWRELSERVALFVERNDAAPRLAILRFDNCQYREQIAAFVR